MQLRNLDHLTPTPDPLRKRYPAVDSVGQGPMASTTRGIIVLGMHRAGTSAITKILMSLGFELPGEPVPASADNPKGYWEPREIVEIHDAFLHAIGRSWSDPRPLPPELFRGVAAAEARGRLREVVERVVLPRNRWVVKDPRMCRLIPLWEEVLPAQTLDVHFLHLLRSPLSVASSLAARDGFSRQKSCLLWLRHCLEAEAATRGKDRTWLHFEQLTRSSQSLLNQRFRIATGSPRLPVKRLRGAVEDTLDLSLVHYEHEIDGTLSDLRTYPWLARAYRALDALSTGREADGRARLDELGSEIRNADALLVGELGAWEAEHHGERYYRLYKEIEQYHRSVEAQRREIEALRTEVGAMRGAFDVERTQLAEMHQELTQQRSAQPRRALPEPPQEAAENQGQRIVESLAEQALRFDAVGQNIVSISESTFAIRELITERLDKRHLTLLEKSLEVIARLESQWQSVRDELATVTNERDAVRGERDAALEARDRAAEERDRMIRAREQACVHQQQALAELERTRRELHQLIHRKSWQLTAPLRWLYGVLKSLGQRS